LVPENELLIRIRAVRISLAPAVSENVAVNICDEPLPELGVTETVVGGAGAAAGFTLMPAVVVALA
jgi:hypothetical protein